MLWLKKFQLPWGIFKFFRSVSSSPPQQHSISTSGVWPQRWDDSDSPEEFNFAGDVLDYWAQMEEEGKRGSNPALWWVNNQGDEIKWSFRELRDLSRRTANVFEQSCGLKQGDHLALILPRVPEWWLVMVGCFRTGIIVMPGTTQLKAKDILYRLQASQAKAIVTTGSLIPEVDSVAAECPALKAKLVVSDHSHDGWLNFQSLLKSVRPDHTCINTKMKDPMAVFFTSGTTGSPKMAKHNQGLAFRSCTTSCRKVLELKTSDILWCMSDPGWILATLGCILEPWASGSTVFIHHLLQFNPKVIIEVRKPTSQSLNPLRGHTGFPKLSLRFPTLEHCATGGESLLPEEFKQWKERTGIFIHELYGQSEMGLGLGVSRKMKIKKGSMGKAILPFDIQIIDEKGNILPPNTEGYLGIRIKPTRPLGLFVEYENNPEKTAEVECGDFYNSGDRAAVDEDGYFWFLGRGDDVINASGYRIGPAEVENALAEHPAVAESAAVGSPDQSRGESQFMGQSKLHDYTLL
ncbi:Acyl-coenzyme A synthetase ACSM1, mitochondrial [Lemmus lemmus]